MKALSRILSIPFLVLFMSGIALSQDAAEPAQQQPPKDIDLSITKVGAVWKVVITGTTQTEVHVAEGQKVIFHAEGTDVYMQFDNDQLFGGHAKTIKNGKKLTLGVGKVKKGIYTYAAFCAGPGVFAEGGSPPKIIVD